MGEGKNGSSGRWISGRGECMGKQWKGWNRVGKCRTRERMGEAV